MELFSNASEMHSATVNLDSHLKYLRSVNFVDGRRLSLISYVDVDGDR